MMCLKVQDKVYVANVTMWFAFELLVLVWSCFPPLRLFAGVNMFYLFIIILIFYGESQHPR